jgi:hypothetical protein
MGGGVCGFFDSNSDFEIPPLLLCAPIITLFLLPSNRLHCLDLLEFISLLTDSWIIAKCCCEHLCASSGLNLHYS